MNIDELLAQRKQEYNAERAKLKEKESAIQQQYATLRETYHAGNRAINAMQALNSMSPDGIAKKQLREAFNIQRVLKSTIVGGAEEKKRMLKQEQCAVSFDMQHDNVVFTITIPR